METSNGDIKFEFDCLYDNLILLKKLNSTRNAQPIPYYFIIFLKTMGLI